MLPCTCSFLAVRELHVIHHHPPLSLIRSDLNTYHNVIHAHQICQTININRQVNIRCSNTINFGLRLPQSRAKAQQLPCTKAPNLFTPHAKQHNVLLRGTKGQILLPRGNHPRAAAPPSPPPSPPLAAGQLHHRRPLQPQPQSQPARQLQQLPAQRAGEGRVRGADEGCVHSVDCPVLKL